MKLLIYIIPVAILVAFSQLIVKWRASQLSNINIEQLTLMKKLLGYLMDPYIFCGYIAALLGSFFWLFIISKIPLSTGFPIYIGITFILVLIGGHVFLKEVVTANNLYSVVLILLGIYFGLKT